MWRNYRGRYLLIINSYQWSATLFSNRIHCTRGHRNFISSWAIVLWSAILTSESIDPPMSSYRSCAVILVYNWVGVISWLVVMWRLRKQHLQLNLTDLLKVFSALWHPQLKTSQMSLRQLILFYHNSTLFWLTTVGSLSLTGCTWNAKSGGVFA